MLYYGSINSSFKLWKFYLDILCRIVFDVLKKFAFPLVLTGVDENCRKYTICTSSNCFNLKITKIKVIVFRELVNLCKKLSEFLCFNVNSFFIIDAFKTYEKGEDFLNQCLEMKKKKNYFLDVLSHLLSKRFNIGADVFVSKKGSYFMCLLSSLYYLTIFLKK